MTVQVMSGDIGIANKNVLLLRTGTILIEKGRSI